MLRVNPKREQHTEEHNSQNQLFLVQAFSVPIDLFDSKVKASLDESQAHGQDSKSGPCISRNMKQSIGLEWFRDLPPKREHAAPPPPAPAHAG